MYQDEALIAIDKPAGLLVHRTGLDAGETRFAVQLLREQIGQPVWPAHRLDKGTSGVLLFALDATTARALAGAFEASAVRKIVGPTMAIVTPGIRPAGAALGDQKRVMTPADALKAGSSHLVVARPIVKADDPLAATKAILAEMDGALKA